MSKQMDKYNEVCEAHLVAHRTGAVLTRARGIENTLCVAIGSNVSFSVDSVRAMDDKELLEAAQRMQDAFDAFRAEVEAFTVVASRVDHAATVAMYAKIGACAFGS